ncbi:TraR/DksA C4-type zinc finger protein [Luteimonas sp. M1R5S18]|jgi:RNA polymerase-binding transcription factor DksA|uniref:TraR/DksA C4-type zinc finger protein n=1 Tax=Luteimonas rhizosphaericola TaxID=3042024 RepID=A0ABT6JNQ8_9GAMM|nr:TraR/DksA C4-type zinc finger protein [Luteimonas rhizosphaericola]MDH5832152.1 TraR/DksA C4-type zinc finger protein [Luteimonas rhizosphaericola]
MPDAMDAVQADVQARIDDALARHRLSVPARREGLSHCEVLDCGEEIEDARRRLGARRCTDCQREADIRAGQFAPGRGR